MKNYYNLLHIPKDSDPETITTAFKKAEKNANQSKGKSQKATKHYKLLKEAYVTLSNPAKREAYDTQLRDFELKQKALQETKRSVPSSKQKTPESSLFSKNIFKNKVVLGIGIGLCLVIIILLTYFLTQSKPESSKKQSKKTATSTTVNCKISYQPDVKKYDHYPTFCINVNKTYTAVVHTTMGDMTMNLLAKNAPKTVNSFVFLAKSGFYNNIIIHRVIPQFVIQFGDPQGNGTGGPGYSFNDEINAQSIGLSQDMIQANEDTGYSYQTNIKSIKITQGVVAMANSGPNTNGSQLYIALTDQPSLDGKYTPFGQVTSGMDIANNIAGVPRDSSDKPTSSISIKSIDITEN